MKPISIKMQAFGPYLKETECDFEKLYAARLFLICGPTGGGKTTILDAMSFALYGFATGGLRGFSDMRNIAAPESLDTEVEFVFTLGSQKYKFMRRLHIHKKRTGTTEEQTTAECHVQTHGEWKLIVSGNEPVKKKACEVLGFTHNQFSQVIVLPQGEFRKLLIANSSEKLEILQVLFSTSVWQKISELINHKLKSTRNRLEAKNTEIGSLLESTGSESFESLCAEAEALSKQYAETDSLVKETAKELQKSQTEYNVAAALEEKFKKLSSLKNDVENLNKLKPENEKIKEEYELGLRVLKIAPYYSQLKASEKETKLRQEELNTCEIHLKTKKDAFEKAEKDAEIIENLKNQERVLRDDIVTLSALLPDSLRLVGLDEKIAKATETLDKLTKALSAATAEFNKLNERIDKGEKVLSEHYEKYIRPLPSLHEKYSTLSGYIEDFERLSTSQKVFKQAEVEFEKTKTLRASAETNLKLAERNYKDLQDRLSQNTAYALAIKLTDGTPCPVCGSSHHPDPARETEEIDKEKLELAEQNLKDSKEAYEKANTNFAEYSAKYMPSKSECDRLEKVCEPYEDEKKINDEYEETAHKLEECKTAGQSYEKWNASLSEMKSKRESFTLERISIETELNDIKTALASENSAKAELLKRLGDNIEYERLEEKLKNLQTEAAEKREQFLKLESAKETAKLELSKAEEMLIGAKKALKDTIQRQNTCKKTFSDALVSAKLSESFSFDEFKLNESELEAKKARFEEFDHKFLSLTNSIKELATELDGKARPDCETLLAKQKSVSDKLSELNEKVGEIRSSLKTLTSTKTLIEQHNTEIAVLEKEYSKIARVSGFVNGKNPRKTPLHNFVVGLMLDEVVLAASRYLMDLSRGRYQLVRVDSLGGNSLRGLDIEVTDAHIGGQRKVCTLSGGELFLASLSLAFGLAEVVQQYAGGVKLDSIFIDEGFGTLDAETLEAAMRALADIQKEGRFVGIISHVGELKNRIPAKIEIIKNQDGSTLKVTPD